MEATGRGDHMQSMYSVVGHPASKEAEPVFVWNWILQGDESQRATSFRYGLRMMEMLGQNGGGFLDIGSPILLEGEPQYNFAQIGSVHYPSRLFFSNMVMSSWMNRSVRGKVVKDTVALLTVPWRKQTPVA